MGQLTMDDITEMIKLISATYPYAFKEINNPNDIKRVKELWYALLSDYPKKLVIKAFHNCMKTEKVNIVPANIIEQIEKIQSALEPSEQEMWAEFMGILAKAERFAGRRHYTLIEPNGKSQGENAIDELRALFSEIKPEYRRYIGDIGALIMLSEISADDLMQFERPRFIKTIKNMQAETKIQETYPALGDMVKGLLKEKL